MITRPSAPVRMTLALVGALVILGGSVQAGLAVPVEQRVQDATSVAALDYTAIGTHIRPLSEEFIARVLGRELSPDPAPPSTPSTAGPTTTPPPSPPERDPVALVPPPDPEDRDEAVEHPPTNDRFGEAVAVSGVPYSASTDGTRAGRQSGEPADCAPVGGTLWYRYDAANAEALVASTAGTQGTVVLGVFTGQALQDLTLVGCDTGVTGEAAVPFTAAAGQTYYFQVSAAAGAGRVVFNLDGRGVTHQVAPATNTWVSVAVSGDGRWVAFSSTRDDLDDGDDNGVKDVFVRDMITGEIERVSVASDGSEGNGPATVSGVDISDDGRFVGFFSHATNLVESDTNDWPDLFIRDRHLGRTERVSVWTGGGEGIAPIPPDERITTPIQERWLGGRDRQVSLSADGRMVAFGTMLTLEERDETRPPQWVQSDVYVHDRLTGETSLAGLSVDGRHPAAPTWFAAISGDGRVVSFRSYDDRLTPGDDNGTGDIFVRDLTAGTTERVSVSSSGVTANDLSHKSALAFDGRSVAFASSASNLVPNDTNGLADVFVHDRVTGVTERVSVSSAGDQQQVSGEALDRAAFGEPGVSISHDGRFVAFDSPAPNLVPGDDRVDDDPLDSSSGSDVFVHDRLRHTTVMVSVGTDGRQGDAPSIWPSISGDGRHVGFASSATDLTDPGSPEPGRVRYEGDGAYLHTMGTGTPPDDIAGRHP